MTITRKEAEKMKKEGLIELVRHQSKIDKTILEGVLEEEERVVYDLGTISDKEAIKIVKHYSKYGWEATAETMCLSGRTLLVIELYKDEEE